MCQKCQNSCNSYFFNFTCYIFLLRCQSTVFCLRQTIRFQKTWSLSSTSELDSWLTKFCKSVIVLKIFDFANHFSQKNIFEFFSHGMNWRLYKFRWPVDGRTPASVTYIWLLIGWTYEKLQSIFLFYWFQAHNSSRWPAWVLPTKSTSRCLFCQIEFFEKLICSIFHQLLCATLMKDIAVRLRVSYFHLFKIRRSVRCNLDERTPLEFNINQSEHKITTTCT